MARQGAGEVRGSCGLQHDRVGAAERSVLLSAARALPVSVTLFILIAALSACAVKLAPSFDALIVQGLTKANERAMTLFASVANGASAASFPEREAAYNETIGAFEAVRLLAEARPNPSSGSTQLIIFRRSRAAPGQGLAVDAPTPAILVTLIDTLTKMRETDRANGLSAGMVRIFKRSFEISMDQVLTYEKALER
jgi:hypothetical protein